MCDSAAVSAFSKENAVNLGLLVLRLGVGINLAVLHGLDKVRHYGQLVNSFPDHLGMGHRHSFMLAIAAEFAGAILVTLGFVGRLAALLIAFSVGLTIYSHETSIQREPALLYLAAALAILMLGSGRWALDAVVWKRFRKGGGSAPKK